MLPEAIAVTEYEQKLHLWLRLDMSENLKYQFYLSQNIPTLMTKMLNNILFKKLKENFTTIYQQFHKSRSLRAAFPPYEPWCKLLM